MEEIQFKLAEENQTCNNVPKNAGNGQIDDPFYPRFGWRMFNVSHHTTPL